MIQPVSQVLSFKKAGTARLNSSNPLSPDSRADAFFKGQMLEGASLQKVPMKAKSPSARLQKLALQFFKKYFELEPESATQAGIPGYDHLLSSYTDKMVNKERDLSKRALEKLEQIPRESLTPDEKFDYDLFKQWLEDLSSEMYPGRKWYDEDKGYKTSPNCYGTSNVETIFTHVIYPNQSVEEDVRNVASRLMQFPRVVKEGMKNLTHDTPQIWVKNEIEEISPSLEFLQALTEIYKGTTDKEPELREKLEKGVRTAVKALQDYQTFLKEKLLPVADGTFAIGPKRLAWELKNSFFVKESPVQLEAWAKRQIRITRQKMEKLAGEIEPGKTPAQVLKEMENEHSDPKSLLDSYRFNTMRARKFIIDHKLVTMPQEDNLEVIPTPSFLAHETPTAAYYTPKPFGKVSKGTFVATIPGSNVPRGELEELLSAHNIYLMRNTIVHEAYPGHHIQLSRAREIKESPLRHILGAVMDTDVKVEGWGLYSEQLMEEEGFNNSKKEQMMRLKWLLHRQIRVLIGIGLHTGKLTRDQAVEKFVKTEPGLLRSDAEGEVDYFTQLPLQPLSYAIGHGQILKLREKLKKELGKDFSLQTFHDAVLNTGNLPLGLVEKKVEHELLSLREKAEARKAS